MTKHLRRLAALAALAILAVLAVACDRVVELYNLDGPPYVPPFIIDARALDASPIPRDALPPPIDAGVALDVPSSLDAPAGALDGSFAAPPAGATSVRTRP